MVETLSPRHDSVDALVFGAMQASYVRLQLLVTLRWWTKLWLRDAMTFLFSKLCWTTLSKAAVTFLF